MKRVPGLPGLLLLLMLPLLGCPPATPKAPPHFDGPGDDIRPGILRNDLIREREKHLKNLRQITFGGENAEAYWSFDGKHLSLQARGGSVKCDQIYTVNVASGKMNRISTGTGRTTCAHYVPDGSQVVFASTHAAGAACPPAPDFSRGYVWPLYDDYDIYTVPAAGGEPKPLIAGDAYDAEATICKNGAIVFTSTRDGDVDLYSANADGTNVKRLTSEPGYDGGAFFSADCSKIVWRASRFEDPKMLADYKALLAQNLVRPSKLDIYVMDADGNNATRVTRERGASFAPFFFPDSKRIIFSSNMNDARGRNFDLYAVDVDGKNLEQITFEETFDSFPMFSPDGKYLAFSSNRGSAKEGETNVFIAEWVP